MHAAQNDTLCLRTSLFFCSFFLCCCASQVPPSGGPKDLSAPQVLKIRPPNKSTYFNESRITFYFDETIQERQLKQNFILTPKDQLSQGIDFSFRDRRLVVLFENKPSPNTTYSLNLSGCISDINEKTLVENLKYVFSTGPALDSLYVSGKVMDSIEKAPQKGFTVMLSQLNDTLPIFKQKPYLYTKTDAQGSFTLDHLKEDTFLLFAFFDKNRNQLMDLRDEPHGFLSDTIYLKTSLDSLSIRTVSSDAQVLRKTFARPFKSYFDLSFNKALENFSAWPSFLPSEESNTGLTFHYHLNKKKDRVRFYPPPPPPKGHLHRDSLRVIFWAEDAAKNFIRDTLQLRFSIQAEKSIYARKKDPFSFSFSPPNQSKWYEMSQSVKILFSKPVLKTHPDSLKIIHQDSLLLDLPDSLLRWNRNRTELLIESPFLSQDFHREGGAAKLHFGKGSFVSVENDSSQMVQLRYSGIKKERYGHLSGRLTSKDPNINYIVELMKDAKVSRTAKPWTKPNQTFSFAHLPPGSYRFRIIHDRNKDGRWNPGNILKRKQPEEVTLTSSFNVKANWFLEDILLRP